MGFGDLGFKDVSTKIEEKRKCMEMNITLRKTMIFKMEIHFILRCNPKLL
jgi:hypothetical protein